jgi:hypothetical protein
MTNARRVGLLAGLALAFGWSAVAPALADQDGTYIGTVIEGQEGTIYVVASPAAGFDFSAWTIIDDAEHPNAVYRCARARSRG